MAGGGQMEVRWTSNRVVMHHGQGARVEVRSHTKGWSRLLKRWVGQVEVEAWDTIKYAVVELDVIGTDSVIERGDFGLIGREASRVGRGRVATSVIPGVQLIGGWSGCEVGTKVSIRSFQMRG